MPRSTIKGTLGKPSMGSIGTSFLNTGWFPFFGGGLMRLVRGLKHTLQDFIAFLVIFWGAHENQTF